MSAFLHPFCTGLHDDLNRWPIAYKFAALARDLGAAQEKMREKDEEINELKSERHNTRVGHLGRVQNSLTGGPPCPTKVKLGRPFFELVGQHNYTYSQKLSFIVWLAILKNWKMDRYCLVLWGYTHTHTHTALTGTPRVSGSST